mmetsp:Transcript_9732/g.29101  ORF Transcript_9732/g.29101 Transcript_9732/m.29101 type:complete len:418 (-) Transcript_9732:112-1365(-)
MQTPALIALLSLLATCTALTTSALHTAVRNIRAEHRDECAAAAEQYRTQGHVEPRNLDTALARGSYRDTDVWAAEGVFAPAETRSIVDEINAQTEGWSTTRHQSWQKSGGVKDLPLPHLPRATEWLAKTFRSTVAPLVARVLPDLVEDADDLRVADAFIVQYVASDCGAGEEASLPPHVDGGLVSVNIGLNDAFEGGGTRFERSGAVVGGGDGSMAVHPSDVRHAGQPISKGVRLILVVFCISTKVPELSRRFVISGVEAARRGDAGAALLAFRRAARFDSDHVAARYNLATQRLAQGGYEQLKAAVAGLHRCICLEGGEDCRNIQLLGAFGETLQALGSYAEALDMSSWVLRLAPTEFLGHIMRVKALAAMLHERAGDRRDWELECALVDADACVVDTEDREEFEKVLQLVDALFA